MTTSNPHRRLLAIVALVLAGTVALAACGDDDDTPDAGAAVDDPAGGDDDTSTTTEADADADVVTIRAVDYAFEGVPTSVPAGTRLALENASSAELHEVVAVRVPDGETRSAEALLALPPEQMFAALGGEPATVLLQPPGGGPVIPAVGDGTLSEPGRYVLLCSIPTGADPEEYLAAAAESEGGPPQGVAGGPPHLVNGMWSELEVR